MYFWEKIRHHFLDKVPNLEELSKIMQRGMKLYRMIDDFMKIFKMLNKLEVSNFSEYILTFFLLQKIEKANAKNKWNTSADVAYMKALHVAIKLLIKENPMMPT